MAIVTSLPAIRRTTARKMRTRKSARSCGQMYGHRCWNVRANVASPTAGFAATEVPLGGAVAGGEVAVGSRGWTAGVVAGAGADAEAGGLGGAAITGGVIGCVAEFGAGGVGAAVATATGASNGTSARETT